MNTKGVEDGISDEQAIFEAQIAFGNSKKVQGFLVSNGLHVGHYWHDDRGAAHYIGKFIPDEYFDRRRAVPEAPTFSYQLAMALTRNGADAPHMQAEINTFLYENGWKTMQEVKS